jgi:hypothetical protein
VHTSCTRRLPAASSRLRRGRQGRSHDPDPCQRHLPARRVDPHRDPVRVRAAATAPRTLGERRGRHRAAAPAAPAGVPDVPASVGATRPAPRWPCRVDLMTAELLPATSNGIGVPEAYRFPCPGPMDADEPEAHEVDRLVHVGPPPWRCRMHAADVSPAAPPPAVVPVELRPCAACHRLAVPADLTTLWASGQPVAYVHLPSRTCRAEGATSP